jgi:CheY-like chemotaxis protein
MVILAALGETSSFQDIPVLLMPAYAVPVANILNGVKTVFSVTKPTVRFTAPDVRVLVVDDIMTNLKIVQGLLSPYRMQVDICDTGESSIFMVRANRYDLVFMDHMMPGMDGIEAMTRIRALDGEYFAHLPIIALTANAMSGMQEMFLSKGFDDYLAKPIEINKLNEIIEKWTPQEKREKAKPAATAAKEADAAAPSTPLVAAPSAAPPVIGAPLAIEGVDTEKGLAMTGGSEKDYMEVLSIYCEDVAERLEIFRNPANETDTAMLTVYFHALKSASASIGADALSKEAALLEAAGKSDDTAFIRERFAGFCEELERLKNRIEAVVRGYGNG